METNIEGMIPIFIVAHFSNIRDTADGTDGEIRVHILFKTVIPCCFPVCQFFFIESFGEDQKIKLL